MIYLIVYQDLVSNDTHEVHSLALVNQCNLPNSDAKHLALINDRFKAQSLRSSMDHLNSEVCLLSKHKVPVSDDLT